MTNARHGPMTFTFPFVTRVTVARAHAMARNQTGGIWPTLALVSPREFAALSADFMEFDPNNCFILAEPVRPSEDVADGEVRLFFDAASPS